MRIPATCHVTCTARIHAGGASGPLGTDLKFGPVTQAVMT